LLEVKSRLGVDDRGGLLLAGAYVTWGDPTVNACCFERGAEDGVLARDVSEDGYEKTIERATMRARAGLIFLSSLCPLKAAGTYFQMVAKPVRILWSISDDTTL
jgi:hypothetical protein